jgi:hypothetical protein
MYVLHYMTMLRCWQLVWILIRTNHPCLRVGCHKCLIKWSYQRSYQEFIMCFMSPNSKDVWSLRLMLLSKTPSYWNRIWHTRHTPSRFSTNKTESGVTRPLGSTRSMEWSLQSRSNVGTWGIYVIQLPRVPSIEVTTPPPFPFCIHFNLGVSFLLRGM